MLSSENNSSDHPAWQTSLTSELTLWTEGTDHLQTSHLVRPHQSFCLHANTRIGCLRNNSRTFTKKLNFSLFLYLVFFVVHMCVCVCVCVCVCFCVSVLLFSPSLLIPILCPYFPSFSCAIIHCSPSQLLSLPHLIHSLPSSSSPHLLPQPVTTLPRPPIYSPPAD
jgi:hypothetical protein